MSLDILATSVTAVVGTSLLLFLATSPRPKRKEEASPTHYEDQDYDDDRPRQLQGVMRYSSYHRRKRYSSVRVTSSDSSSRSGSPETIHES
mmetsp:Transcript_51567/g.76930  ORF Transcript_51567/g.76930 Transcript_51567/m.76930 type:complete len:91 (-) Transcript_51567:285-557(-)|eukprot:CAMPEP_0194057234 /NCGR_PEP_ID=MMETSP0009_2-20130614/62721_1 /TAXON_ID=210454 /ORGANISM="Grammatophora oceanica, Strain CCMP 410" /LENGTH=90 /DNA_ID=CAMNT_0038706909 /DNA_START=216 /DNA_END=488 /DNA_ORIENTATION=+